MESQSSLSQRAYQLLQMIVDEIGPRPAGSEGEERFLQLAEGFFQDRGFAVEKQAVPNVPSQANRFPLIATGVAGLLAAAWFLPQSPWVMLLYLAVFSALPKVMLLFRRKMGGKATVTGHNLIAIVPSAEPPVRTLILCAHHDTARASRIPNPKLGELARNLLRLWPPIMLLLTVVALARVADIWFPFAPDVAWQVVRNALMVLLGLWGLFILAYQVASMSKRFSPGANDNGSGVAALMAAAEVFAREPLRCTEVRLIFFSAEENGLLGSEHYVKERRNSLKSAATLNLDMVGSGQEMTFVRGAGMFPPRRTTPRLNALLRQIRPGIRGRWYWMGDSDFSSFLAKKIPAVSLEASGRGRENVYHTDHDTMDHIQPELLAEAMQIVLDFARALDGAEGG